jgi:tetratricopeptide (TPR) repeat protein
VATELGAGVVLTGSVRPQADQVKVTLELVDPGDGVQIWSGQYTRDVKDIFAVQAQVAEEVARALRVKLQPTPASARTASRLVDQRAYELYLRGRQAAAERRIADAVKLFDQAIAVDAGLSEAFAGLAEALHLQVSFLGEREDASRKQRRREAAARAYQLDPDLPQANLAMALAADSLAETLGYMRRAIELDPSFTEAYHQVGDQIADFDPDLALRFYRRSLQIDPGYKASRLDVVTTLEILGRWDEAGREVDAIEPPDLGLRSRLEMNHGRFDRAAEALQAMPNLRDFAPPWFVYIVAVRSAGRGDEAFREASQLAAKFPEFCEGRAVLAGLALEHGQAAAARRVAAPILRAARASLPLPPDVRCGALAAAAMKDAATLGAVFDRIAADEPLLRHWALLITGISGRMFLRGTFYPWAEMLQQKATGAGRQHLDAAYARERAVAQEKLAGLLDR